MLVRGGKLVIPYREFEGLSFPTSRRSVVFYRPVIPVILFYGKRLVQMAALLDTGADYNIFHGDVAAYLGINLTAGSRRNIVGIGGKVKGYQHQVRIKINSFEYKAPIIFSNKVPENTLAVLGNKGFFDRFVVKFDYRQKVVEISR